jgi:hypothetical protein
MLLVPLWSARLETPEVVAVARFATDLGAREGWLRPLPDLVG